MSPRANRSVWLILAIQWLLRLLAAAPHIPLAATEACLAALVSAGTPITIPTGDRPHLLLAALGP